MKLPSGLKIDRIEESPVLSDSGDEIGKESYVFLDGENQPVGGGFGATAEEARTIAISETIERFLVWQILESGNYDEITHFGLDKNPSSSGFAYGFDPQAVAFRSLCEAFEHHVRFHGLYLGKRMETQQVYKPAEARSPASVALGYFDSAQLLYKTGDVYLSSDHKAKLTASVVLATDVQGAYVGASAGVGTPDSHPNHALLEAWRNKRIVNSCAGSSLESLPSVRRRNVYFGIRKELALAQVNSSTDPWPEAKITVFVSREYTELGGYLTRAVINDTPPWSDLAEERLI